MSGGDFLPASPALMAMNHLARGCCSSRFILRNNFLFSDEDSDHIIIIIMISLISHVIICFIALPKTAVVGLL